MITAFRVFIIIVLPIFTTILISSCFAKEVEVNKITATEDGVSVELEYNGVVVETEILAQETEGE